MPRALLIDLDGVVRRWDPAATARIENRHGLPAGSIATAAFGDKESLCRAVTGTVSDACWRADISSRLADRYGDAAKTAVLEWSRSAGKVDERILAVVQDVRRTMPVGLLTNATTRLSEDLAALHIIDEFDTVINSADIGIAKPDRRLYVLACSLLEVEPPDCMFVDDTASHVEGAQQVGLRGHIFRCAASLQAFLHEESLA